MYGENEINNFHLLKYSVLYDFFVSFSSIKIYGLPLAQCLAAQFLVHIKPFVDKNQVNQKLIKKFRMQKNFETMGDINKTLLAFDNISQVSIQKNKKSMLLSDDYYEFAVDQLKEYEVTLYGVLHNENHTNLPKQFRNYLFREEILKVNNHVVKQEQALLKKQAEEKVMNLPQHYYFNTLSFQQWFSKACISIVKWVYILDKLILKTRPSVIIIPSEASLYGFILGLLSKKYQIPFVNMPISAIGDRSIIPSRADYYFVWGQNQKNWFIKRKIREDAITETGNVKFYYEKKKSTSVKESLYGKFNIPSNHYILGFTSQPFQSNDKIEEWIDAIPNNLPITILIKKHRFDQYKYPSINKNKNVKILPRHYPLYDFLYNVNCLMTISSTTAFEAALLDKPLLILQPSIPYHYVISNNQNNTYFAQAQAGEVIENETELIQAVTKVTTDPSYVGHLLKKGNKFLSETIITVDQAPILAKNKIEEIIMKQT
ncbi:CDP-glycerol glycerophosphotransferase family protein [Peribacillus butanolivorans]|uniref:CDP-glycerol glycerophosphotransferase family protein n=1 Tax=Peribacillus butanolivorans TaxID=421767 RepID=UPI0030C932B7